MQFDLSRKLTIFCASLIICVAAIGQSVRQFETLDRFFAGTPLKADFEKWYFHFAGNPHLGIDSTNRFGNHSSFKDGIETYFPFPDQTKVKVSFRKVILVDLSSRLPFDSASIIEVQGVFGKDKPAKKESRKFYRGVRKELMRFYRYEYRDYHDQSSWFYRGKTSNFMNCSLHFGTDERSGEHYVLLSYSDQKNLKIKSYPPPDNTLRN